MEQSELYLMQHADAVQLNSCLSKAVMLWGYACPCKSGFCLCICMCYARGKLWVGGGGGGWSLTAPAVLAT